MVSRKDEIIERLKENGCRITRQRRILIDIILENDCASCKEIFYKASQEDKKIGISRKNMYRVECGEACADRIGCEIILEDDTVFRLPQEKLDQIVREGARQRGYLSGSKKISRIIYHGGQT